MTEQTSKATQVRVVALCVLINMLDGFDILAMAYAAPALAESWQLDPKQLGLLFSVGLAGMMAGSILIGPLGDRFGRRPVILACLAGAGLSMVVAASASSLGMLIAARLATGLVIGGTLPCINTMAAEYSTERTRTMAVALTQAGFPIGAALGGFLAVWLLTSFGWQAIFFTGAGLAIIMIPAIFRWMPESRAYASASKFDDAGPAKVPVVNSGETEHTGFSELWLALGLLSLAFSGSVMGYYFLTSWLPKILTDGGMEQGDAVIAGALLTSGGIVAALALGWLAMKRSLIRIVALTAVLAGGFTFLFGQIAGPGDWILPVAFLLGVFANGTQIGLYATVPTIFPARVRASGTGLAIGLGRGGAVLAPWLAGLLISIGWSVEDLFALMAVPYLCVSALVLTLARWQKY